MGKKRRNVEVLSVNLQHLDPSSVMNPSFEDILHFLHNKKYQYYGKQFELTLSESTIGTYLVGLIITTQKKEIPPKHKLTSNTFAPVHIESDEGLAFANAFLYDPETNVFLYEINKNGCYVNQFIDYIYKQWNADENNIRFSIKFPPILRKTAYERMGKMQYYKKLTLEVYNPSEVIAHLDENSHGMQTLLKHQLEGARCSNSNTIKIEQLAISKRQNPSGLAPSYVREAINLFIDTRSKGLRDNIKTLELVGYAQDSEDSKRLKTIDFIADSFEAWFLINEITIQSDVQPLERKDGILNLYQNKLYPEISQIMALKQ